MKIQFTSSVLALLLVAQVQAASTRGATINRHHRRAATGKAGKGVVGKAGKGTSSSSDVVDETLPPTERIVEPEGSNDGSFLEHICGLYADFSSFPNCQEFDQFQHLMCPHDYEVEKICASAEIDLTVAAMNEFCTPLFRPLNQEEVPCEDLCMGFVQANCCNIECP
eukprot:CAMPEP_0176012718 /NCGR_PEP_ID=MMETSP0120_2-20121206/5939_1 /TAXON_ID=160619 /ORGANISM="Kryptoperidinium foliaceum, Strain CCMP 1326" /LENGTH=166 /DNA_ID=CAMNT_0017345611 /DNA_START=131 /DNA_END=631 /DNA_ORIENTATION=-